MKNDSLIRRVGIAVAVACLAIAPACHAYLFTVTIDTSGLLGDPAGPFTLDYQLIDGSGGPGDGNNTVSINNFSYGGGGAPFGPVSTIGGASGNLSSGLVSITDTVFWNEFYQSFAAGSTLKFDLNLTTNSDAPSPTSDQFVFFVLDNALVPVQTTDLTVGRGAVLVVDINSATPSIEQYELVASMIPEPSTIMLFGLGGAVLLVGWLRRRVAVSLGY